MTAEAERTFRLFLRTFLFVVEDVLEALVDNDFLLVLSWFSESWICAQSGEPGI